MVHTGKIEYSASAKETYLPEYKSLTAKLNIALKNAPRERQAQVIANSVVTAKEQENPDMTKSEKKKAKSQALSAARTSVGAKRENIKITDREWEAIQAGAISENKLYQILNNTDIDDLRARSMPRTTTTLSQAKVNKIKSMQASGYSTSEIAEDLGISSSTVTKYLKGKEKGYHTCAYLGRIARTSSQLTEDENDLEVERAIDEIIKYDFRNIYRKVIQTAS